MKKISIGVISGLSIALLFSFKTIYESKTTTAEADIVEGLVIFTNSKPVNEYTVIGNVRTAAFPTVMKTI